ncbi:hypothetical protein [Luteibacter sp.]
MESKVINDAMDLEALESRLEMEAATAAFTPLAATTPVCICHFW